MSSPTNRLPPRAGGLTTCVATVIAALALTACGSGTAPGSDSSPGPSSTSTSTSTTSVAAAAAAVSRPNPIATLGIRAGDLPTTFTGTDSEPLVTPTLDARLRRCAAQPAAPRATETHQSGWNRDRRRHEAAVLTTALRYADQDSAARYTGLADANGAAACFDTLLTRGFQGTGEDYIRVAPHSAVIRARTSGEPGNVTAVVTYRFRSAPPAGTDPSYGQIDIYYLTGPRLGAALTNLAFNEKPDVAVRTAALHRFAARIAHG